MHLQILVKIMFTLRLDISVILYTPSLYKINNDSSCKVNKIVVVYVISHLQAHLPYILLRCMDN